MDCVAWTGCRLPAAACRLHTTMHQNRHAKRQTNVANDSNEQNGTKPMKVCTPFDVRNVRGGSIHSLCKHKQMDAESEENLWHWHSATRDSDYNLCMHFVLLIEWDGNAALLYVYIRCAVVQYAVGRVLFHSGTLNDSCSRYAKIIISELTQSRVASIAPALLVSTTNAIATAL